MALKIWGQSYTCFPLYKIRHYTQIIYRLEERGNGGKRLHKIEKERKEKRRQEFTDGGKLNDRMKTASLDRTFPQQQNPSSYRPSSALLYIANRNL